MQIGSRHGLCDTMVRKYEYESRKGTVKMVQCSSPSDICMICMYILGQARPVGGHVRVLDRDSR